MINTMLYERNEAYQTVIRYANGWKLHSYINSNVDTQTIRAQYPKLINAEVFSGQKRIVIPNPADVEYVLKIATSYKGVLGNMNEIIVSNHLEALASSGYIGAEDLKLFALASLGSDKSPYIIHQRRMLTPQEDPEFAKFVQARYNPDPRAAQNPLDFWALYIEASPTLKADRDRIQDILSQFFICSDINPYQEPLNYATTTINGVQRLVLIDLDSILPIYLDVNGRQVRPQCPKCGQPLIYQPIKPQGNVFDMFDPIINKGSYYFCMSHGCLNSFDVQNTLPTTRSETTDITVFDAYQQINKAVIRREQFEHCNWYVPFEPATTYTDFCGKAVSEFPEIPKSNEDMSLMFDNYMTYLMADTIQALIPSGWHMWVQQMAQFQYLDWIANMRTNLISAGIQPTPIYNRILALLYINSTLFVSGDIGYIILLRNDVNALIRDIPLLTSFNQFNGFNPQANMNKLIEDLCCIY